MGQMFAERSKAHKLGAHVFLWGATGAFVGLLALRGFASIWIALALAFGTIGIVLVKRNAPVATIGLFAALVAGEVLGNRAFSHLVVLRAPFYITEVGMFVIGALLLAQGELRIPPLIRTPFVFIMALCGLGMALNIVKYPVISVLRDSAELYYMMFIPISYSVFVVARRYVTRELLERIVLLLAFLAPVVYIVTRNEQLPAASEAVSASLLIILLVTNWTSVKTAWIWPATVFNVLALVIPGARGPWVGALLGIIVVWIASKRLDSPAQERLVRRRITWFLIIVIVGMLFMLGLDHQAWHHIARDFASLWRMSGTYNQVANNRWRIIIWESAFRQIVSNPFAIRVGQAWLPGRLVALGYGGVALTGYGLNTVALANSYLQMVQWYGLWIIVPFYSMLGKIVYALRREPVWSPALLATVGVCVIWAVNAGVEVVLEGPYMSSVVWTTVGFCLFCLDFLGRPAGLR